MEPQAAVALTTAATGQGFVLLNLLVDILYCWVDPRIRYA